MPDVSLNLLDRVRHARERNIRLQIIGGGSKAFMGRKTTGTPLDVSGHSGIVSYQPDELVITARAGTTIADISGVLKEKGQMLAFDSPELSGNATLAGSLACDLSGPGRPWTGSVRDHVLGLRLINGKAEHLKFGGQVMKNVAGYDVTRMQAGAMGTLGVITELSLKVMPEPASVKTVVHKMDADEAIVFMNRKSGEASPLSAACWLDDTLYLRYSGARSAVDSVVEKSVKSGLATVLEDAVGFWSDLRDFRLPFFDSNPLWRFSIKSSTEHCYQSEQWLIDWAGSQRWLKGEFDGLELKTRAEQAGGHVSLFRGGDREAEVFHSQGAVAKMLHQRMKMAFDPDGLFNPGRLYSWM